MDPKPSEYMDTDGRTSEALKLEQIRLVKGLEELGHQTRVKIQQIIANQRSRGVLSSGGMFRRAASPHFERARSINQTLESVTSRGRDLPYPTQWTGLCGIVQCRESLKQMQPSA